MRRGMPEEKCESIAPSLGGVQNLLLTVKDKIAD